MAPGCQQLLVKSSQLKYQSENPSHGSSFRSFHLTSAASTLPIGRKV